MPPARQDRVSVACPKCGHTQLEPPSAYSSICKKCHAHFRLAEVLRPAAEPEKPAIEQKLVRCFQCGTELHVPLAASSTMCKRCSSHVDLNDHRITQTVSKNFRTYGRLVIEEKGYVLNSEAMVREAVVKGRFIGKLTTEGNLEIHSSASIKGTISPGCLVIPAGNRFGWAEPLRVKGAEIAGELVANVTATGLVRLKSTARFFGDVEAADFVVESGAVFVGAAKIGRPRKTAPAAYDD
jgi:cytoskeletal protein CcmA (bactofilin family)